MERHQIGFHRTFQYEYGPDCSARVPAYFYFFIFILLGLRIFFRSVYVKGAWVQSRHSWDSLPRKFLLSGCKVLKLSLVFLCKDKVCLTFRHKIFFYPRCNLSITSKPSVFVFPFIQSLLRLSLHRLFNPINITISLACAPRHCQSLCSAMPNQLS